MKNNPISYVAQYFRERYRSLVRKFRGHGPSRKTSDFGSHQFGSHDIVLKERTWRIEVSQSKAKRFFKRHKTMVLAGGLVLIAAAITTRYILVGFASTVDFYPSSCLGDWQNVQNALGKPDLSQGSPASDFTSLNSAVFVTSTAQMFCGNFSGDTDINTLTGKSFEEADLVLSWSFVFPQAPSSTVMTSGSGDGTNDETDASDTVSQTSSTASSSSSDGSSSTTEIASSTDTTTGDSSTPTTVSSSTDAAPAATTDTDTTPAVAPSAATTPASTPDDSDQATPTTPATPAPAAAPAPTDPSTDASSPTSWLQKFVGVAYADDVSSTATDMDTSTTEDANAVSGTDDAGNSSTNAAYAQTGTSTTPEPTPITVDTSAFQNITVPSSTGDAVISIVYSTDGVTWQPLVNVDSSNWQQGRYPIPIHSWQELQHLQVAFVGLGASSSPQVLIDAAGVEVSYQDAPQDPEQPTDASDTDPTAPAPAPAVAAPPAPTELPPVQAFKQVFDPFAGQQCSVTPFSESVSAGGSGSYLLRLTPPPVATSSAKTSSSSPTPQKAFLYDASVGSLPDGITATIAPEGAGVDSIGIRAASTVLAGSYNAVVVYKEYQSDGSIQPNFCQFNLVVTTP